MSRDSLLSRYLPDSLLPRWPNAEIAEIRKRARILVIDDSEFPYVVLFKRDGYVIDKWDDVDDLHKLESGYYDIILLDIQNVGKSISTEQGLGVLKHIHQVNPAQIIIAYSNSDWPLKYQDFFAMADASLSKTADYVDFKRRVDELLVQKFSIEFYIERIIGTLSRSDVDEGTVRKKIRSAIMRKSPTKLESFLKSINENKETISLSIKVVGAAISLLKSMQS